MASQLDELLTLSQGYFASYLSDSLFKEVSPTLDLGPSIREVLSLNKHKAYKDVEQPLENDRALVIRTGECSGQFQLQVYQRL